MDFLIPYLSIVILAGIVKTGCINRYNKAPEVTTVEDKSYNSSTCTAIGVSVGNSIEVVVWAKLNIIIITYLKPSSW